MLNAGFRSHNEPGPSIDVTRHAGQGEAMRTSLPTDTFSALVQAMFGVVIVSVLLSGCAVAPGGNTRTVEAAEIVDGYDCLAPNLSGWVLPSDATRPPDPEHQDAPDAGRVPVGFTPSTAVRCDDMATIDDAEGQWTGVTAVTLAGDLGPLLAALAEPDEGTGSGPCTADMEIVSPLWLVDANGRAINAHYPRDRCAKTKPGVRDALAGLSVRETTTLKRALVVPRAALDSGCAAAWTAPHDEGRLLSVPSTGSFADNEATSPLPPAPMADIGLTDVDGMRWCRYLIEAAPANASEADGAAADGVEPDGVEPDGAAAVPGTIPLHSGRFVAGGMLETATARLVAEVAASEPQTRSCDESATVFLSLWPRQAGQEAGMIITVELDGCELLYRNGRSVRTLPADVRALLVGQTTR